jgi:hypothetical protein
MLYLLIEYSTYLLFLCFKTTQMMSRIVLQARKTRERSPHIEEEWNECT